MWWRSRDDVIRKKLIRSRATAIADFRDGTLGKIVGRVRCLDTVAAPVSGRRCTYFEVSYMRLAGSLWVEHNRWIAGNRFHVVDDSGEAVVEVDHCDVSLLPDHDWRDVLSYSEGLGERRLEGILSEGERVAVLGFGRWEPDPDPRSGNHGYRNRPVKLVLRGGTKERLLISDKPTIVNR